MASTSGSSRRRASATTSACGWSADDRDRPEAIDDLSVRARDGKVVELRNLVHLETGAAASQISRTDRQRSVTIVANLEGMALGAAIERGRARSRARSCPRASPRASTGDAEAMEESGRQFGLMLALAILVIYMVLAAQFESFLAALHRDAGAALLDGRRARGALPRSG